MKMIPVGELTRLMKARIVGDVSKAHQVPKEDAMTTATLAPRQTPWAQIGTKAATGTVLGSMQDAGLLDWNMRKTPLMHVDPEFGVMPVPEKFVNVGNVPGQGPTPLGVVGERYWPLSNETVGEFVDVLVGTTSGVGGTLENIGTLYRGSRAFVSLRLSDLDIVVGDGDVTQMYLNALWSHDGSTPVVLVPSPTRLSCTNQLRGLTRGSDLVYRVRHLSGAGDMKSKVADAQAALGLTKNYQKAMQAEGDLLVSQAVTDDIFAEIIAASFPEIAKAKAGDLTGRGLTMAENREGELFGIWRGDTVAGAGIGGTAWGALQAIGEYTDWIGSVKGSGSLGDADARAVRALGNPAVVENTKARARRAVLELVGV